MTTTKTSICNLALDTLTQAPLTDVDTDNTPESRWFVRNYEIARDAEYRAHPWKFATTRASLTVDGTAPAFGWDCRYALPTGYIRLLPLTQDGEIDGMPIPHEIEADASTGTLYILTDEPSTLKVRYIKQITDPTKFDPLFVVALGAKLAMMGAHRFTGKQSMLETAAALYSDAIAQARLANAIEGTAQRPAADDVIAARYA